MYCDEFLPTFDVSDSVGVVVDAGPAETWDALMDADLIAIGRSKPLVGRLGGVRMLPGIVRMVLHGDRPPKAPRSMRLRETTAAKPSDGGWVLLGDEGGETLALGLVGKFGRPAIVFAAVERDDFRDFAEPGWAKTIYELSVHELDDGRTLLTGVMRTATTDEHARRWFRRYWTLGVGC